jgi:hypothetical protein
MLRIHRPLIFILRLPACLTVSQPDDHVQEEKPDLKDQGRQAGQKVAAHTHTDVRTPSPRCCGSCANYVQEQSSSSGNSSSTFGQFVPKLGHRVPD